MLSAVFLLVRFPNFHKCPIASGLGIPGPLTMCWLACNHFFEVVSWPHLLHASIQSSNLSLTQRQGAVKDGVENVKCGEKIRSPSGQTKNNDSDGKVVKEEGEGGVDLSEGGGVDHDQGVDDLCQDAGKQEDAIQGGESHPPPKFPSLRKDTIDF